MVTKQQIEEVLDTIPDPEIGISLVQLGLVYGINIETKTGLVTITISLTSIGCPLFDQIAQPMKEKVTALEGVKDVIVELTFDPPWTVDRMSADAKLQLGF